MEKFMMTEHWRVFRVLAEFIESIQFMASAGISVSVFGSARLKPGSKYYRIGERIGRLLAEKNISVITGGGPGIMEAVNKGASVAAARGKGRSIGLNIELPYEQAPNKFVTHLKSFHYFFIRKVMFVKYAKAVIVLPGGYGTMDEFFEVITLVQTGKIKKIPIVLVGSSFWLPFIHFFKAHILKEGLIEKDDMKLFTVADTAEDAVSAVLKHIGRTTKSITDNLEYAGS
ncbi:MAG: TIGR00730 family Rossman fold protein [Candidatus Margulisbacteria bacterium]|jgi:uncharacterized protein (TIGR00730 family)|nr:TIGR00730 family Rossman fold protein [Candidatus Margulisiibacteriota bacterium]